ncbi:MAG: glyoxalase/bleomycin resistance/extradiol dioxygenase family protein [Bacteroidia bacterium]|nr:glyoxalase/bleomycin resistance/extradiol dioxygenase family protein [Bacteroidia bacterium]
MVSNFLHITPVLPSDDLVRDIQWYSDKLGFSKTFGQEGYAVLHREDQWIHLQWHANTAEDPLNGGSVVKIFVRDIQSIFKELLDRGSISPDKLNENTPWGTHEIGLYDLSGNAIYFVQDI